MCIVRTAKRKAEKTFSEPQAEREQRSDEGLTEKTLKKSFKRTHIVSAVSSQSVENIGVPNAAE